MVANGYEKRGEPTPNELDGDLAPRRETIEMVSCPPVSFPVITQPKTQRELAVQHLQRFEFTTSLGEVILKRISYLDHEEATCQIIEDDPEAGIAYEKLSRYNEIAIGQRALQIAWEKQGKQGAKPIDFPEDLLQDRMWARAKVAKHNWRSYGPCFVKPEIKCKEDLDSYLQNLQPEERQALVMMLVSLISPMTDTDKNLMMLGIAHKYGIKWAPDLFMTNMTLQQAQVILNSEQRQLEIGEEVLKNMATRLQV